MSNVKTYTSEGAKDLVKNTPDVLKPSDLIDDIVTGVETYRSTQEATDTTFVRVDPKADTLNQPQLFTITPQADARGFVNDFHAGQRDMEQEKLRKDNSMYASSTPEEKEAIVSVIFQDSPEIVFRALAKYHSIIDKGMLDAGLVETSRSDFHEKKYDELLADLVSDREALTQHIKQFATFLNF